MDDAPDRPLPTGAPATPSRQGRLWRRFGWVFGGVWLVFLVDPFLAAVANPDRALGGLAMTALVTFAVVYLRTLSLRTDRRDAFGWAAVLPGRRGWATLVVLTLLAALAFPGAGMQASSTFVFIAVFALFVLPLRWAVPIVGTVVVVCLVLGLAVPGWSDLEGISLSSGLAGLAVFGVTSTARRGRQLAVAQADLARLAVAEERTRFSRDLHDLLGHSLTVVTLKAELAGRLLEGDSEAARARAAVEVADIERLARDALSDVRAALEGYREVSLGTELAGARQALAAAGIEASLPGAADDVSEPARELFGWVVREGVTNVVRHSGASRCWVELSREEVAVCDDGRGPGPHPAGGAMGSGLRGLAARVSAAGGTLTVGRSDAGGFEVRVGMASQPPPVAPSRALALRAETSPGARPSTPVAP